MCDTQVTLHIYISMFRLRSLRREFLAGSCSQSNALAPGEGSNQDPSIWDLPGHSTLQYRKSPYLFRNHCLTVSSRPTNNNGKPGQRSGAADPTIFFASGIAPGTAVGSERALKYSRSTTVNSFSPKRSNHKPKDASKLFPQCLIAPKL